MPLEAGESDFPIFFVLSYFDLQFSFKQVFGLLKNILPIALMN